MILCRGAAVNAKAARLFRVAMVCYGFVDSAIAMVWHAFRACDLIGCAAAHNAVWRADLGRDRA
jgi:hypothetical protein